MSSWAEEHMKLLSGWRERLTYNAELINFYSNKGNTHALAMLDCNKIKYDKTH